MRSSCDGIRDSRPGVSLRSREMARYRKPLRFRPPERPPPSVGSEAFGVDPDGRPTGAEAFGEPDPEFPLRGALLFGNDPDGQPLGAEMIGAESDDAPLRGALLFGNDPAGEPRGSEAFGGDDSSHPLRGALLFGNDPAGDPRGSEAFGAASLQTAFVGSESVGAPQLVPERITKDPIGYDFKGALLRADDTTLAGIRKDPLDRIRKRVVTILERRCAVRVDDLRHGVNEHAIPWGRMRRDSDLDRELAELMRAWWRKAPGEVLGICHLWELLEESERMHTFELRSPWDQAPRSLHVYWDDERVASCVATFHKEHQFYLMRTAEKQVLGYIDRLTPRRRGQQARIRAPDGRIAGVFTLESPSVEADAEETEISLFRGRMEDGEGQGLFRLEERRSAEHVFLGELFEAESQRSVGLIEDRTKERLIETHIELDVAVSRGLAWATATLLADLARFRRAGWPEAEVLEDEAIEPIDVALGRS